MLNTLADKIGVWGVWLYHSSAIWSAVTVLWPWRNEDILAHADVPVEDVGKKKGIDERPYCMSIFMNEMKSVIDKTSFLNAVVEFRGQGNVDDLMWPAFAANMGRSWVCVSQSMVTGLDWLSLSIPVKSRFEEIEASWGLWGLREKGILWIRDTGSHWPWLMSRWYEDHSREGRLWHMQMAWFSMQSLQWHVVDTLFSCRSFLFIGNKGKAKWRCSVRLSWKQLLLQGFCRRNTVTDSSKVCHL